MAASPLNLVDAEADAVRRDPGDIPDALQRRYLTDGRGGGGLGYYADARSTAPLFRDQGRRLSTDRNDPQVIRDLVAIAAHRRWTRVSLRGHTDFRREAWRLAREAGLEVRGYQPTERDLQTLSRRVAPPATARAGEDPATSPSSAPARAAERLRMVEAVVNSRLVDPDDRNRIMSGARARIAAWLERGAPQQPRPPERSRPR